MNISTRRFNIESTGFGTVTIRDNDAPYHCHTVQSSDLPSVEHMAAITEDEFNGLISKVIYS